MLSFLNEEENSKLPEGISDASQQPQEESQSSGGEDYLMPSTTGSTVKNSTILLTVLLIIGATSVWLMVRKVGPREASAESTQEDLQIESAIAKLTGIRSEMYGKLDQVAERFYQFSNINQVPSDQLVKNPFVYSGDIASILPAIKKSGYKSDENKSHFRLWSIMESDQGRCCMINDKILYVGDSIEGLSVTQIGRNAVELGSNDRSVVLRISQ